MTAPLGTASLTRLAPLPAWTTSLAITAAVWVLSRLSLALAGVVSFRIAGHTLTLHDLWWHWDAGYYFAIETAGYTLPVAVAFGADTPGNMNFFPAFPLGARFVGWLLRDPVAGGLVFANACLLAAGVGLHRLTARRAGSGAAAWAVVALMTLPGTFVLSAFMSESLFLAVSVWSVHLASSGRFAIGTGLGAILTATRVTGIALPAGYALEWLVARLCGRSAPYRRLLLIALMPLPLLAFMAYLAAVFGDGLAFFHTQTGFWHHRMGVPFQNLGLFAVAAPWPQRLQSALAVPLLLALLAQARRLTIAEAVFCLLTLASSTSSISAAPSLLRYIVGLYPVHLAVGAICARSGAARMALAVLGVVNIAMAALWMRGDAVLL